MFCLALTAAYLTKQCPEALQSAEFTHDFTFFACVEGWTGLRLYIKVHLQINNHPAVYLFCSVFSRFRDSQRKDLAQLPLTRQLRTNYFENKTSIFTLQESINNDSSLAGGPPTKTVSVMFQDLSIWFFFLKFNPGNIISCWAIKRIPNCSVSVCIFIDDNSSTILNSCVVVFRRRANQMDGWVNKQIRTK